MIYVFVFTTIISKRIHISCKLSKEKMLIIESIDFVTIFMNKILFLKVY